MGAATAAALAVALLLSQGTEKVTLPSPLARAGVISGITANALDANTIPTLNQVRRVGAGWIREEFRWPAIEPRQGIFRFGRYDALMTESARRGLHVLPLLLQSPAWLTPQPLQLPPSLPAWERFVSVVVQRYGPGGTFWKAHPHLDAALAPSMWEIWNEPYLSAFSYGGPDPATYAQLVAATVAAGRAANPATHYLVAAETTYVKPDGSSAPWLPAMFAAVPGLGADIDALAVHPYTSGSPGGTAVAKDQRFQRIRELERELTAAGSGPRPLWLTEIGWSTCSDTGAGCVSADVQARYLSRMLRLVEHHYAAIVKAVFIYRLDDLAGSGPADPQSGFGLKRLDGTRKPAWFVVAAANRQP